MSDNLRETIKRDQAIIADPNASPEELPIQLNEEIEVIAAYLANFCGPRGYVEQAKDPLLADFLADLYCKGTEMAVIRLVGPDATRTRWGEAMDAVKGRIGEILAER